MATRVAGTVRAVRSKRGTFFSIRFESRGAKWTHRVGGDWEGWTREKVDFERERLVLLIDRGEYVQPTEDAPVVTLAEDAPGFQVVATDFLARFRAVAEEPKTVADLEWRLRNAVEFFGNAPLNSITSARLEDFQVAKIDERRAIDEAAASGEPLMETYVDARGRSCTRRRRGLNRDSINKVVNAILRLLDDAERRGELAANPAPKPPRQLRVRRQPRSFLELYQARALFAAADELEQDSRGLTWEKVDYIRASPLSAVALAKELHVSDVLIGKVRRGLLWNDTTERPNRNDVARLAPLGTLLLFGVRIAELCGLDAEDLDFASGRLRIPRDITKTDAGERIIPMLPRARELLLDHVMSRPPAGTDKAVFVARTGRRQSPPNVRAQLALCVERANQLLDRDVLPPIMALTPHSMRRTYASLLAEANVPPRRAMRLLGHTDPTFTMGVYQQVLDMGGAAEDHFAELTGATLDEAFTILSERRPESSRTEDLRVSRAEAKNGT